jgi:flavodoxin
MNTLIIYDSVFGNTEQIAQAIGQAIGSPENVKTLRVNNVAPEQLSGVGLLIVGSPTRGFRPTEAMTKFLEGLPAGSLQGVKVAAFDTRIAVAEVNNLILTVFVRIFGYAAKPIGDKLTTKGGALVLPPEGFYVKGSEGPLKDGELERAAGWAKQVLSAH